MCLTCSGVATKCDNCSDPTRHLPPKCECRDGFYDVGDDTCNSCYHPCVTCKTTNSNCLTCFAGPNRNASPNCFC